MKKTNLSFKCKVIIVLCLMTSFFTESAKACGTWQLEDLESKHKFTFKISGVELIDENKPDPEFMQSGKQGAYFAQGDRLKLKGEEILLSKLVGKNSKGKRKFSTAPIASFSHSTLKLSSGTTYQVFFTKDQTQIRIEDGNNTLLGLGEIKAEIHKCEKDLETQIFRVAYYLVWKSLKIDPFAPKAENWWW